MKAKELQIGDWVCYNKPNGYVTRVDAIRRTGEATLGYVYSIDCKRDERDPLYENAPVDSFNVEILHPVPITPDILKRNGFRKDTGGEECWACKAGWLTPHKYDKKFEPVSWEVEICGKPHSFDGVIVGVHELQQALRLCKVKKEIKLED